MSGAGGGAACVATPEAVNRQGERSRVDRVGAGGRGGRAGAERGVKNPVTNVIQGTMDDAKPRSVLA